MRKTNKMKGYGCRKDVLSRTQKVGIMLIEKSGNNCAIKKKLTLKILMQKY